MGTTFKPIHPPPKQAVGPKLTTHTAHNIFQLSSKASLVKFLHQCLFSPPKKTLIKALDNDHLPTRPVNKEAVEKYLPDHLPATDKGSIRRQRQGVQSTKKTPRDEILHTRLEEIEMERDFHPPNHPRHSAK